MLTFLFFVSLMETPQTTWSQLINSRIQRNSSMLDPAFWTPEMQSGLALQEYLMTLGQNGHPDSPAIIKTFFHHPVLQGTALFAYGEASGASPEPLFEIRDIVREEHLHLLAEALSKLCGPEYNERLVQLWSGLPEESRNGSLYYFWRNRSEAMDEKVKAVLENTPAHGSNGGYVYYLYRSRTPVSPDLAVRLLKNYRDYPQILIYASRIKPTGITEALKNQWVELCGFYDWRIRVNALNALKDSEDKALIEKHAFALLEDANPNVCRVAILALLTLDKDEINKKLAYYPATFTPSQTQTLIVEGGAKRSADFYRLAKNWDESSHLWKKVQWLRFLKDTKDPAHLKILEKKFNGWAWEQGTPGEKTQAFQSLVARKPDDLNQHIKVALDSGDVSLMAAALDALTSMDKDSPLPYPIEGIKSMASKFYVAPDFHSAYLRFARKRFSEEAFKIELTKLLNHPDYLVRNLALEATSNPTPEMRASIYKRAWLHRLDPDIHDLAARLIKGGETWHWVLETSKGKVTIKLQGDYAPITCSNIAHLSNRNYFDNMAIHRVVPNFVVQAGDNRGDGSGGPGYSIPCEVNTLRHRRGSVGMALSGKDTGGSQFFINHSDQPHLDGGYTVFGHVIEGMGVVDRLEEGDLILTARVIQISSGASNE